MQPATSSQRWVAAMWSDVLGVQAPRLNDTFSGLGGHSLHAVRMVFLLRAALGIPVPVSAIFDTADLGELCRWLESRLAEQGVRPDFATLPTRPTFPGGELPGR